MFDILSSLMKSIQRLPSIGFFNEEFNTTFTTEELVAFTLSYAKRLAQRAAGSNPINTVILVVS